MHNLLNACLSPNIITRHNCLADTLATDTTLTAFAITAATAIVAYIAVKIIF